MLLALRMKRKKSSNTRRFRTKCDCFRKIRLKTLMLTKLPCRRAEHHGNNMKRKTLCLALLFLMTGCGKPSEVKKVVLQNLKDPDSVKWGQEFSYMHFACVVVNAKNSLGGYTGDRSAWLVTYDNPEGSNAKWHLEEIDDSQCTKQALVEKSERDRRLVTAQNQFEAGLINALTSKRLYKVSGNRLPKASENDPAANKCLLLANRALVEHQISSGGLFESHEKQANRILEKLKTGNCE